MFKVIRVLLMGDSVACRTFCKMAAGDVPAPFHFTKQQSLYTTEEELYLPFFGRCCINR